MSVKRDWNVPVDLPERVQSNDLHPVDRGEAQQAFVDAETMLNHLGGGLIVQAVRVPFGGDRYLTVGYQFRHDSYVPAVTPPEVEEEPVETEVVG